MGEIPSGVNPDMPALQPPLFEDEADSYYIGPDGEERRAIQPELPEFGGGDETP